MLCYRRPLGLVVASVLVLAGSSAAATPQLGDPPPARLQVLHWEKLPDVDELVLAGKFTVFENRATRQGRTIDLNVIVLPALDESNLREPLFHLEGGPGVAATAMASLYATDLKEYRRHRDVVLVDQRGTGRSNPLTAVRDPSPQAFLREMYPVDYVKALRAQLEKKADLTQYTTSIAMDDLDDIRAWLGYDQIDLFGLSYGSRAVQEYLRRHEAHVRCAILMGVTPTGYRMPLHHARSAQRALDLLFDEVAHDPVAARAFPNLREEFSTLLAGLGREPARVRYVSEDGKTDEPVEITRDVFAEKIRAQLYSAFSARRVPLLIHSAARGNFEPFLRAVIPADRTAPEFIADGMYLCVTSAEDTPFIDPAEAEKLSAGTLFGNYRVFQQMRAGKLWPRGKIPEGYLEPVTSRVPVLLVSGNLDPVTPPEWAEEVAKHLPNSRHIVLTHSAHLPNGLSNIENLDKVMMAFLDAGDARSLDTSGLAALLPPAFATE
jgi:pimeloyl-ACP methyl ester carboxylesterase